MRIVERYSLENRLLAGALIWLLAICSGLFLLLKIYADNAAQRAFDRLLLASALSIADAVKVIDGNVTIELPYASHAILAIAPRSRIFYRVSGPDGALITGYPDLAKTLSTAKSPMPVFGDSQFGDAELRVVGIGRFVSAQNVRGWVMVVSGETKEERNAFAHEILVNSFLPIVSIVLVASALIWFVIRRALKPLAEIEGLIGLRKATDFTPFDFVAPREVHQLVSTLNRLLARYGLLLSRMQEFLGTAAHQIRTPLASLQAQVDVALDEEHIETVHSRLQRIRRNAQSVTHLANQLLADTMVAHRGETVPLTRLIPSTLCHELVDTALSQSINLEYPLDPRAENAQVMGDELLLKEAVRNLLDNARKYAGEHSQIELSLAADEAWVYISVSDRGPGIAEQDRHRVIRRFTRGHDVERIAGSGLGLSIVLNVVERHSGRLQFTDRQGGGLKVIIALPRLVHNVGAAK